MFPDWFLALMLPLISTGPLPSAGDTNFPAGRIVSVERVKTPHLKAAHEDALRLQQKRKTLPPLPGFRDYKSIIHAHAEDSAHTGGTRAEMLADAKQVGVQVIMLSDHLRPPRDFINDSWRGLHDGVLFIPGSEARGFLVYPVKSIMDRMDEPEEKLIPAVTVNTGLIFLSHIEERKEHSMEGLTGMEIYNRHYDAKKDMAGVIALALRLLDPAKLAQLQEDLRLYPDELLAAQVTYQEDYLRKWDAEAQIRRLTGIAANDCHHNQIFVVKMVDEKTVLIGTNVDKEDSMRRITADFQPGISQLTKGHKPGDILARADFDPYFRSFRDSATHILAPELTEEAIRAALQQGHAFVSHDWMCDPTGFVLTISDAVEGGATRVMGDQIRFAPGQKLRARFPVSCHARLLRNGKVISEFYGQRMEYAVESPGVYRVEGWLTLDREDRPWIYSNPIYVR